MSTEFREYEDMIGHLARRFQQIGVAVFQAEMDAIGCDITPVQYAALSAIAASPGIDQATLAGEIALDRTTISGVLDRLVAKSLVTRLVSEKDRRARELSLTPAGVTMLQLARPSVKVAQNRITGGLNADEVMELKRLIRKAVEAANMLSRAPKRSSD